MPRVRFLKLGFWQLAWTMAALLGVSAAFLVLNRDDPISNPDSASLGASGTSAFAELLRRSGYRVESVTGTSFELKPDDVAIAVTVRRPRPIREVTDQLSEDMEPEPELPIGRSVSQLLEAHFGQGGKAIVLGVPHDFSSSSAIVESSEASLNWQVDDVPPPVPTKTLRASGSWSGLSADWVDIYPWIPVSSLTLWSDATDDPYVQLLSVKSGQCAYLPNGTLVTNRFLAKLDNATLLMATVHQLAPAGSRIVFLEAAHGMVDELGLLDILGPWAKAAWWQFLILFVVIVLTLGKRFGLPDATPTAQGGSSDLSAAVTGIMNRSRATHLAMEIILKDADSRIRKHLKLRLDASTAERDAHLPAGLLMALKQAEVLAKERAPKNRATEVARVLESELAAFLGPSNRGKRSN